MISFLHTYQPQAILFSFGSITIYWYGLFVVTGISAALALTLWLAKRYGVNGNTIFDLAFWLIINGIIGARLYDDLLQLPYYMEHPGKIFKIWEGGLAIHGAIIAGLLTVYFFAKKRKISGWQLTAIITPGLALGQAIGRWGNYFNQEIFGLPTSLPWGIPIALLNRPAQYITNSYFQPTFLYESLGCVLISLILLTYNIHVLRKGRAEKYFYIWGVALYMILYSILRFSLEFMRLDETPAWLGLRAPQVISLIIIIVACLLLFLNHHARPEKNLS